MSSSQATHSARALLTEMFKAAVEAADPVSGLKELLPSPPKGRTIVIAIGKAAIPMAIAFEQHWPHPMEGVVVDRHEATGEPEKLRLFHAAHPVPDAAGQVATEAVFQAVSSLTPDDLVIALISGGGSALLPAPVEGLTLEDEQEVNRCLLASGLAISEMNLVRTHLSRIKGGGLTAAARPARVITYIISDVPGDDPSLVSSGPTLICDRGPAEVLALLARHELRLPERAEAYLHELAANRVAPPSKQMCDQVHLLASAEGSLKAAAARAEEAGYNTFILSDAIEGEASTTGQLHAAIALRCERKNMPFALPAVILSGGETTVTIRKPAGRGGRNSEFLLAFAKAVTGSEKIHALAADTDGIDGSEDNAGAFADGRTVERLLEVGVDPSDVLRRHDAYSAFDALGDLFITGPTGTNVNDFRAILIDR